MAVRLNTFMNQVVSECLVIGNLRFAADRRFRVFLTFGNKQKLKILNDRY
jgi:hypothetical protein